MKRLNDRGMLSVSKKNRPKKCFILLKKGIILITLANMLSTKGSGLVIDSKELTYGSLINQVHVMSFEGEDNVIPQKDALNILFFFNINYVPHTNILNNINFFIVNINHEEKVKLFGISKGEDEAFKEIKSKYNISFKLINDKQEKLFDKFHFNCSTCLLLILIDKNNKLRYLSSYFDPVLLRELVQRYIEEGDK